MYDNFDAQIESWLIKKPPDITPVEFAAVVYACQSQIMAEDWSQDKYQEHGKRSVLEVLKHMSYAALFLENHRNTGCIVTEEARDEFQRYGFRTDSGEIEPLPVDTKFAEAFENTEHPLHDIADWYIAALNYEVDKNRDFFARSKAIAESRDWGLDDLDPAMCGILGVQAEKYPPFLTQHVYDCYGWLCGFLNTREHPYALNRLKNSLSPQNGPKDAYSAYFLTACVLRDFWEERDQGCRFISLFEHRGYAKLHVLLDLIGDQMTDLDREKFSAKFFNEERFGKFRDTHYLTIDHSIGHLRFYLAHSKGKIPEDRHDFMCKCLDEVMKNFADASSKSLNPDRLDDGKYLLQFQQPTPDQVASGIKEAIQSRFDSKKAGILLAAFDAARADIPAGMEEAVVYYYPEDPEIKGWRKNHFRKNDGPKSEFVRYVAFTQIDKLLERGFTVQEIREMQATSMIPSQGTGSASKFNVDHINDREFGGTNHQGNFVLVPKSINEAKDLLKRRQLAALPDVHEGAWILTWRPRPDSDGITPLII